MSDINPYAPPEAMVVDVGSRGDVAPALWNPGASTAWCLLFTPVFGAILQMKNWQALGEPAKAARSRAWAIGSAIFTVVDSIVALFLPMSPVIDRLSSLTGLVLLLVWYFANGREQIGFVRTRFGKVYPRRRWTMPLLAALAVLVVFLGVTVAIAIAVTAMSGEG